MQSAITRNTSSQGNHDREGYVSHDLKAQSVSSTTPGLSQQALALLLHTMVQSQSPVTRYSADLSLALAQARDLCESHNTVVSAQCVELIDAYQTTQVLIRVKSQRLMTV